MQLTARHTALPRRRTRQRMHGGQDQRLFQEAGPPLDPGHDRMPVLYVTPPVGSSFVAEISDRHAPRQERYHWGGLTVVALARGSGGAVLLESRHASNVRQSHPIAPTATEIGLSEWEDLSMGKARTAETD